MKRIMLAILALSLAAVSNALGADGKAASKPYVCCTTYPIYIFTMNIMEGVGKPELLIPPGLGCPHDYALTPKDMMKLTRKPMILVMNGLGLEDFLGTPVKKANPEAVIIDSSAGIEGILSDAEEKDEHGRHEHKADCDCGHSHGEQNPHLFASPFMALKVVDNIAYGLKKSDPANAAVYEKNRAAYSEKLKKVCEEFKAAEKTFKNRKIATQHDVFDYLAKDIGLEITATVQAHPGSEPSAVELKKLIETLRKNNVAALFVEPQYPQKIAGLAAKEAKIPLAELDPVASGSENPPADYYEKMMRKNIGTLKKLLSK